MNRVKFDLNITSTEEKTYTYNVLIGSTLVYTGKLFVLPSQPSVTLDLTDVLNNYKYKGAGMLTPQYSNGEFHQPTETLTILGQDTTEQHYNNVVVRVYDGNTLKTSANMNVYFHTIPFNMEKGALNNNTTYFGSLVPRMPRTQKLRYAQLVYNTSNTAVVWKDANGNSFYTSQSVIGSNVHNVPVHQVQGGLWFNGNKILKIDECSAPYYLCWMTSNGGFQCQPFIHSSVYTEEHTRNNKVSMDDMTDVANSMFTGKWKLRSGNITDAEYAQMMDIMRSPYVLLYDSFIDKVTYVNVSDTTMEQKKYVNNGSKLLYFEINLTSREAINNVM